MAKTHLVSPTVQLIRPDRIGHDGTNTCGESIRPSDEARLNCDEEGRAHLHAIHRPIQVYCGVCCNSLWMITGTRVTSRPTAVHYSTLL